MCAGTSGTGTVTYLLKHGTKVDKGDIYAEIINSLVDDPACKIYLVKTSTDGILFAGNVNRFVRPGRIVAKVAGRIPPREESGNILTL